MFAVSLVSVAAPPLICQFRYLGEKSSRCILVMRTRSQLHFEQLEITQFSLLFRSSPEQRACTATQKKAFSAGAKFKSRREHKKAEKLRVQTFLRRYNPNKRPIEEPQSKAICEESYMAKRK